jgi:hypothetical protein
MHPVLMRQLAADHIREMHAKAKDECLGRQARRARHRPPSPQPRPPANGTLSYDDPRLAQDWQLAMPEEPSAPPLPVMADSRPDSDDAIMRREAMDHCR